MIQELAHGPGFREQKGTVCRARAFSLGRNHSRPESHHEQCCFRCTLFILRTNATTPVRSECPSWRRSFCREKRTSFAVFPQSRESRLTLTGRHDGAIVTQFRPHDAKTIDLSPIGRALSSFSDCFGLCGPDSKKSARVNCRRCHVVDATQCGTECSWPKALPWLGQQRSCRR